MWRASALLACLAAGTLTAAENQADPDTIDAWTQRSDVEVLDFKNAEHRARLKKRGPGSPPVVIKNALTKSANKQYGSLVELAKFGKLKTIKGVLMANGDTMGGVKMHKKAHIFSYWDKSIQWLGKEEMGNHKKQHLWHKWQFNNEMPVKSFFKAFPKNSTPHLYWQQDIPEEIMGQNPRPALCKRVAMTKHENVCAKEQSDGTMWLNSNGQIAQAHFDREFVIFVQLHGSKRWTFFSPQQLGDLCLYPYMHPALRQIQADLGNKVGAGTNGVGKRCPRAAGLHNRSIIVEPGDMLIVGPYHVHRVEAMSDSISYSFPFDSDEKQAHSLVGDALYEEIITPVLRNLYADSRASSRGRGADGDLAADIAAHSFRFLVREILQELFKSKEAADAFLARHWDDFEVLPDIDKLTSSDKTVQDMCKDESKLLKKSRKAELKEQAKKFVKLFGGTGLPDFLFDETMRYIVGTAIVLCHGSVHPTAGLFIGSIKNGTGTNIMHSTPLIAWGETKVWYDALSTCDGKSKAGTGAKKSKKTKATLKSDL